MPRLLSRPVRFAWGLLLAGLPAVHSAASQMQPAIVIRGEPTCASCQIAVRTVMRLGMPADSAGYPHAIASVVRDSKGQLLVTPLDNMASMGVFSASGALVNTIGRTGQGPGEYMLMQQTRVSEKGELVLLDAALHRMTQLDADGQYQFSMRLPGNMFDVLPLRDGRFLVNGNIGSAEAVGYPLHVLDELGNRVSSFGSDGRLTRFAQTFDIVRAVALSPSGEAWCAPMNAYRLERWNLNGAQTRLIVRDVEWFQPWSEVKTVPIDVEPAQPLVRGIQVDTAGLIYVFIRVASSDWKPEQNRPKPAASADSSSSVHGVERTAVEEEKYLDTIIEVVDPVTGTLLQSRRLPFTLYPSRTPGLAFRHRDDLVVPQLEILEITFNRSTGRSFE